VTISKTAVPFPVFLLSMREKPLVSAVVVDVTNSPALSSL